MSLHSEQKQNKEKSINHKLSDYRVGVGVAKTIKQGDKINILHSEVE